MQKREQYLLGMLLLTMFIWWARPLLFGWLLEPLQQRENQITQLKVEAEKADAESLKILQATRQLAELRQLSLSADSLAAQRDYTTWLTDQLEQAGWSEMEIQPGKITRQANAGSALQVRIEGKANSEQLARFLARFHAAPVWQRLERIKLQATSIEPDSPLQISLTAEAFSLNKAQSPADQLSTTKKPTPLDGIWQQLAGNSPFTKLRPVPVRKPEIVFPDTVYLVPGDKFDQTVQLKDFSEPATIELKSASDWPDGWVWNPQSRKIIWNTTPQTVPQQFQFQLIVTTNAEKTQTLSRQIQIAVRPENHPPQLEPVLRELTLYTGESWSVTVAATDTDLPAQKLHYELVGTIPPALRFDSSSNQLQWTPPDSLAGQTASFQLRVTDSGQPPQSATQTWNVQFSRNPERDTRLIGCIEVDGVGTAWLANPTTHYREAIRVGQELQLGRFQATVHTIAVDYVIFIGAGDAQPTRLELGQPLSTRKLVPASPP